MKQFDLMDKEFLVVNLSGRFLCLDGRCTHAGAPLMEGSLDGTVLTCPWHGSRFDVMDGSVVGGPAKKPLNVYRSKVSDGQLFVEIGADGSKDTKPTSR
jgi:nitrite reductase/ring-hydroxylating ferredoxin subunit